MRTKQPTLPTCHTAHGYTCPAVMRDFCWGKVIHHVRVSSSTYVLTLLTWLMWPSDAGCRTFSAAVRVGCMPDDEHIMMVSHGSYVRTTDSVNKRRRRGLWFNIKMSSYQYRKSHCGDKTVVRSSYLHTGISYTGTMAYLYWISPLGFFWNRTLEIEEWISDHTQ